MAISFISLPCPICDGCGGVDIAPGMEDVHVMRVSGTQITSVVNVCEMYTLFQYDVTVKLTNTGFDDVDGWLKMVLRDYSKGTMLDRQYVTVCVPAETTIDVNFKIWFRTGFDVPITIEVHAESVTESIPDDVCSGTGRLPLNMWLMVSHLRGTLMEASREHQEFIPPAPFFPNDSWAE